MGIAKIIPSILSSKPPWPGKIVPASLTCQLGDLFISYFKRLNKIKNTGTILPGHGGLLDRIDGIIFAIPIVWFLKILQVF